MPRCFDCANCAPLDKNPVSKLDTGQWGMLARGLVYCGHLEPGQKYMRFRSCEAATECPYFQPEPDERKREGRRVMAKRLQDAFLKQRSRK